MNLARVARLLSGFALFFAIVQIVPWALALADNSDTYHPTAGFTASITIGGVVALLLWFAGRTTDREFHRKESLLVVGLAWLLAGVLGSIPFLWSGTLERSIDAVFETISGLTTTGATVFGGGDNTGVDSLPRSILLWRSMLQYIGGLGIILIFIVVLPAMGVTGKNLLASEQVGISSEINRPRLLDQARGLFRCYLLLAAACALSYWLAGMPGFDAICHALATMPSGGFSTQPYSLGQYDSLAIEIVATVFMFLAGCNFAWFLTLARGRFREPRRVLDSPELRGYAILTAAFITIVTLSLWLRGGTMTFAEGQGPRDYGSFGRCLRDASFNVVSMLTSTGFATANFQWWPKLALLVFLLAMLCGSCTGSTAGGIKVLRVMVSAKLATFHLRRFVRPKSVERLRLGNDIVPDPIVSGILAVLVLWLVALSIGVAVLSFDARLDFLSCLSISTSMLGCTGPALTSVPMLAESTTVVANPGNIDFGPYGSYATLLTPAKIWAMAAMVFGRLEILAPLVLFMPSFWRR